MSSFGTNTRLHSKSFGLALVIKKSWENGGRWVYPGLFASEPQPILPKGYGALLPCVI
jgi:hypothetical protein